ncbi:MAG: ATP-binding cassette domain-containing protein [candidate division Zixibacteria bacterium]|nr:ATP-binding cassette domain-containing protein [candidate division Zixibacteria bacterium]
MMADSSIAVKFEDVNFAYDGGFQLENVNLIIRPGEFVSVVGPNGGGKTTLLKLINGLLQPERGKIEVFGKNPAEVRQLIGYLPQNIEFDPEFPVTVREVVRMGRLGEGFKLRYSKHDNHEVEQVLEETGLKDYSSAMLSEISGGQRQRTLLARTLVCRPRILLLDEPTAYLDFDMSEVIFEILQKLEHDLTIIMVSHDIGFVRKSVKSVICVNRNVVRHPTEQITPEALEKLFRGEKRIVRHDQIFTNGERFQ